MSVVLHDDQPTNCLQPGDKCSMCGKEVRPPCIKWNDLIMCGSCCTWNKKGLMADMVHLNAIVELRALGYTGVTLVRTPETKMLREERAYLGLDQKITPIKR